MKGLGERDRTALRFDESKIAIIRADTSDQSAHKGEGRWREVLE